MNIKIIMAVVIALLLGFIGYNSYDSNQRQKRVEARTAETEALRASIPQPIPKNTKPESVADIGVELEPVDDKVDIDAVKNKTCNSVSEFSESVMKARLRGISIQESLGAIDNSDIDAAYKSTFKGVIVQAYKQPSYQTEEVRERAIREFALKQYLACIEAFDNP